LISRKATSPDFASVFQLIQVITLGNFFSPEEDLASASFHERFFMNEISKVFFWKRDREKVFVSNVLIQG